MKQLKSNRVLKIIFGTIFIFFIIQTCLISIFDLKKSKTKQFKFEMISSYLKKTEEHKNLKIFYNLNGKYNDYSSSVMKLYIMDVIDNDFVLYSKSGCYSWHESSGNGHYQCKKKDFNIKDDYDVILDDMLNFDKIKHVYNVYEDNIIPFEINFKVFYKK